MSADTFQELQHREATLRMVLHQVEQENAKLRAENERLRLTARVAAIPSKSDHLRADAPR